MNVSAMINRINYLEGLRNDIQEIIDKNRLTDDDHGTLDDISDVIEDYINELMRKEVKV